MKFEEASNPARKGFPIVMRFRCTEEERDTAKRRAAETGLSLSTYLRKRAVGGRTNQPIQDFHDLNQLRQSLGLLKQLVQKTEAVRPLLQALESLIAKMSAKVTR